MIAIGGCMQQKIHEIGSFSRSQLRQIGSGYMPLANG